MIYGLSITTEMEEIAQTAESIIMPKTIQNFFDTLPEKALSLGIRILLAVLFFFIGTQLIKLIRKIIVKSMKKANAETGAVQFVDSFIKAALYIILLFMLASYFGLDAASIVALLGSAGVAIGLAVQGSLSNLAGGVLILILKPFKVGDYIIESNTGMEGTVKEIQIFYTKLVTIDNKMVVLPNGTLANHSLVNVTAARQRRLDIPVDIAYSADIKKAREALLEVLTSDEKTLKDHEMTVVVDELGESGIRLIVRCWLATEEYWAGKWRMTEQCKYALDAAGIEIPFPQVDVHMR